ncbi:MAG: hypothetical protein P9L94_02385 [Candidatus Hinthialibacter antarcticus]|nr:hypothetical protein [Candidatus Hinthialibacter antarcticus]
MKTYKKWIQVFLIFATWAIADCFGVEPQQILPKEMGKFTSERIVGHDLSYTDFIDVFYNDQGILVNNKYNKGAISVPLFIYEDPGFEAETIIYSAEIKSDKIDLKAYLEMLCTFPDGKTYFSRGVSQSLSGATTWEMQQTPFFLKAGQRPTRITVGLRFEEPGFVYIRNIELKKADNSLRSSLYFYQSVMPRLLGIIYGCWGAAIGILGGIMVPKGRFKKLVLTLIASMGLFSVAIFILAVQLQMSTGISVSIINQYYIAAGLGIVLSVVFIPIMLRRYQEVELRKMQAKDIG